MSSQISFNRAGERAEPLQPQPRGVGIGSLKEEDRFHRSCFLDEGARGTRGTRETSSRVTRGSRVTRVSRNPSHPSHPSRPSHPSHPSYPSRPRTPSIPKNGRTSQSDKYSLRKGINRGAAKCYTMRIFNSPLGARFSPRAFFFLRGKTAAFPRCRYPKG